MHLKDAAMGHKKLPKPIKAIGFAVLSTPPPTLTIGGKRRLSLERKRCKKKRFANLNAPTGKKGLDQKETGSIPFTSPARAKELKKGASLQKKAS